MKPVSDERYILRASCMDAVGIVADVATFLAQRKLFIVETSNFGDPATGRFFRRMVFAPTAPDFDANAFRLGFSGIGQRWSMEGAARCAGEAQRADPGVEAGPLPQRPALSPPHRRAADACAGDRGRTTRRASGWPSGTASRSTMCR